MALSIAAGVGLLALSLLAAPAAGCAGSEHKRKPLGQIPSAVTTAVPEWLPRRATAGESVASDAREAQLFDLRQLTRGWDVRRVAWASDGAFIAVLAVRPGEKLAGVFRVPIFGGGEAVRLSKEGDDVLAMALSGSELSFRLVYRTAAGAQLVDVGAEGRPKAIDPGKLAVETFSFAPDGSLLLVARDGPTPKLFGAARDGSAARALVHEEVGPVEPAVSPDRAYLAYGRRGRAGGADAVGVASIEGKSPAIVASTPGSIVRHLAFHPRGRLLAYASDRDRAGFDLYAVQFPEGLSAWSPGVPPSVRRLTFAQADAPAFSPDGRSLAFTSSRAASAGAGSAQDLFVARFTEDP
jgi:dipeptidyl aminopeptidase/acylaminoacyl peptidase